ncbi:cysteine desulfurase [Erysipelothrix larvae]|uniref:Cysteine desulfurase n=1 Tax=Erysipelothrix larvae TaxID=1514105 RepID=A0A0X8H021_9FIRM|nr:cysteine desulfurase family protein [Erysipelothrix larvae]AMC93514.1 cysteine desulfurase [Erysipelothrix larvae]
MPKVQNKSVYLDFASTTRVFDEILDDAITLNKKFYANADSLHDMGQRVSALIDTTRKTLAKRFGVLPQEIIFTSGGSESNSTFIKGVCFANMHKGKHIITTQVEHSSVIESCRQLHDVFGFDVTYLPVTSQGVVDLNVLKQALREDTILVSIMAINNELGSINPIEEIVRVVKKHSHAYVHIDAVQALCKYDFSLKQVDGVSFSAHKIHGFKGSGLLIKKAHVPMIPLISGGQQEQGLRGGTLDSVSDILWAKTIRLEEALHHQKHAHIVMLNHMLREAFEDLDDVIINSPHDASPYIINMSIKNVGSEIMMNALNREGYMVSARSTCHSESDKPSEVLLAIGLNPAMALNTIRISIGYDTQQEDIEAVIRIIKETKEYVQQTV